MAKGIKPNVMTKILITLPSSSWGVFPMMSEVIKVMYMEPPAPTKSRQANATGNELDKPKETRDNPKILPASSRISGGLLQFS